MTNLLEKTYFEKKIIVLDTNGDFDTNLKHYDMHRDMPDFLDLMYLVLLYHKLQHHLI